MKKQVTLFFAAAVLTTSVAAAQTPAASKSAADSSIVKTKKKMKVQDVFVLIATDKMRECRDFYVKYFGFTVAFESTIYTQLSVESETGGSFSLAFMPPKNPFTEEFKDLYNGRGAYVTIQVADAAALYEEVKKMGAPIVRPVKDEGWGQRHFVTKDPHGTIVDVVQSIDAAPGYYDQYQVKN